MRRYNIGSAPLVEPRICQSVCITVDFRRLAVRLESAGWKREASVVEASLVGRETETAGDDRDVRGLKLDIAPVFPATWANSRRGEPSGTVQRYNIMVM